MLPTSGYRIYLVYIGTSIHYLYEFGQVHQRSTDTVIIQQLKSATINGAWCPIQ